MKRFFDTAYVAKCYLNEPDAAAVRVLASEPVPRAVSSWTRAELACVLHRHLREKALSRKQAEQLGALFDSDLAAGTWELVPLTEDLLDRLRLRIARLSATVFIRAGDAIQLMSAVHAGADEIWSNDRHLLLAAPHFGLRAKSVAQL